MSVIVAIAAPAMLMLTTYQRLQRKPLRPHYRTLSRLKLYCPVPVPPVTALADALKSIPNPRLNEALTGLSHREADKNLFGIPPINRC